MLYTAIIVVSLVTGYWYYQADGPVIPYEHPIRETPHAQPNIKRERIAIFVHGASHVPLVLLSPLSVFNNTIHEHCWYARAQQRSRHDTTTQRCSLMLNMGLSEVVMDTLPEPLPPALSAKAAYHIIPAFNLIQNEHTSSEDKVHNRFFTFGWSGSMRPEDRTQGAHALYQELIRLRKENSAHGVVTEFALYAFSHGGQLVLELPAIRKELNQHEEQDLTIDLAIISGTPLYRQNTRNLLLGMFKTCVNVYSPGDYVQTFDTFTTPEGKCFQTIAETIPLPQTQTMDFLIVDACITLRERPLIGHQALFQMNCLPRPNFRSRRSEQYTKHQSSVCEFINHLEPLPLLVLYPAFFQHICTSNQSGYVSMTIDLQQTPESTSLATCTYHNRPLPRQEIPLPLEKLSEMRKSAKESYHSYIPHSLYDMVKDFGHAVASLLPGDLPSPDISC